ncbi:MAG TPA: shikimate kinase [Verrucomicrobiae bacterium]|nr:shikimate kinase [Verrucomicrobiae bacterium]
MRNLTNLPNLVLIGFMGTGKSSIGKRLALKLGMEFVDSDLEIEALMGMSISEIWDRYGERCGEVRFRSEESLVIKKLAGRVKTVIATGGGAVLKPENFAALSQSGVIITLTADPEVISLRVARKGNRPLLKGDNSPEKIREMLAKREAVYAQGDFIVDTSHITLDEAVEKIVGNLAEVGYGNCKG